MIDYIKIIEREKKPKNIRWKKVSKRTEIPKINLPLFPEIPLNNLSFKEKYCLMPMIIAPFQSMVKHIRSKIYPEILQIKV